MEIATSSRPRRAAAWDHLGDTYSRLKEKAKATRAWEKSLKLFEEGHRPKGDERYRDVAARHARVVASRMVRSDGSTWSSMHNRRSDGAFLGFHTHQGYRENSTWARGSTLFTAE